MQIKEAKIFNFGKLQNKTITFEPGINVIYGRNESGKTTLHTFLKSMLFGMEKGRGRVAAASDYNQYEPWHASSFYSGALKFSVGSESFYLERNFYSKEKKDYLRNEGDGEELSVAYGDLAMLLGGVTGETYESTYDIPQSGAATGARMSELLSEYLAGATDGTDGSVSVTDAAAALLARKRELQKIQDSKIKEQNARIEKLGIEKRMLEEECEGFRQTVAKYERELQSIEEKKQYTKETAEKESKSHGVRKKSRGNTDSILLFFPVIIILFVLVLTEVFAGQMNWMRVIVSLVFALILFCFGMRIRKQNETEHTGESYPDENGKDDDSGKELDWSMPRHVISDLKDTLQEKETRLFNIEEEIQKSCAKTESMRRREEDILALQMASDEIIRISKGYYEQMEDMLNEEISRMVSLFTAGKYDSVRLNEKGHLSVQTEGREAEPEALSRGTLEQIYLALRIAVGNVVTKEEQLPILLDEAFAMYDDERLQHTLKALEKLGNQILIFTCQKREMESLNKLGIPYHKVELSV